MASRDRAQAQYGQWFNYEFRELGFPIVLHSQTQVASTKGWFPHGHKLTVSGSWGYLCPHYLPCAERERETLPQPQNMRDSCLRSYVTEPIRTHAHPTVYCTTSSFFFFFLLLPLLFQIQTGIKSSKNVNLLNISRICSFLLFTLTSTCP